MTTTAFTLALVHAGLGERETALDWLERVEQVRDVHLVFLPVDPKWDSFGDEPRFQSLLDRCGLSDTARASD